MSVELCVFLHEIRSLVTEFGDGASFTCKAHFCSDDKTICSFQICRDSDFRLCLFSKLVSADRNFSKTWLNWTQSSFGRERSLHCSDRGVCVAPDKWDKDVTASCLLAVICDATTENCWILAWERSSVTPVDSYRTTRRHFTEDRLRRGCDVGAASELCSGTDW